MKIEGIPLPSGPKVFLGNFFHVREDKPRASGKKSRNFVSAVSGGGGVLNKFLYGEAPPIVPALPFHMLFLRKKVPLSYTFC